MSPAWTAGGLTQTLVAPFRGQPLRAAPVCGQSVSVALGGTERIQSGEAWNLSF